jgi:serine/threonine protein kinase
MIAEGHTNIVTLVQNQESQKQSVAKILNEDRADLLPFFKAEASMLSSLDHPRILKSEGFSENMVFVDEAGQEMLGAGMLMEYAPYGDMFDLLTSFTSFPSFIARSYTKQMVDAVSYLHSRGIAHLDIKLENFLLDAKFGIKLGDFGFSRLTNDQQMLKEQVGTPDYWTAEQHEGKSFNALKVDVFNLGITLFLMVAGRMPFERATKDDDYYVHFFNGEAEKFWQMHEEDLNPSSSRQFFKEEFKSLINGMLRYNPAERMTIQAVASHPWLNLDSKMMEMSGGVVAEFLKKKGLII